MPAFVPRAPHFRETVGSGDDEAPKPKHVWLHQGTQEATGEGGQVALEVVGFGQSVDDEMHEVVHLVGRRQDHGVEEALLVGEVLVDSGFGDLGEGGDVIHTGAVIAAAEEEAARGGHDRLTFAVGTAEVGCRHGACLPDVDA